MAYTPQEWRNGDPDTPLTAERLLHIEQGIAAKAQRGPKGTDGTDGQDGVTPHIGENGNWFLGTEDTGTPARGPAGQDGTDGTDGQDGADGFPSEADWNDLVARVEALETGGA